LNRILYGIVWERAYFMEMTEMKEEKEKSYSRRRRGGKEFQCHCCRKVLPFCWNCVCGFQICDACFNENKWGISNGPTWVCPDCGRVRMM